MGRALQLKARATALTLVVALFVAGCGSQTGAEGGTEAPSATPTDVASTGAPETSTTSAKDLCLSESQAVVDAALAPIPEAIPTDSLDITAIEGKSVWIILGFVNELLGAIGKGFEDAGEAAGMNVTVFDGKGNVNTWNQGISQAVAQGADAIMLWSVDPALVSTSLTAANEAGIPVVSGGQNGPQDAIPEGIVASVTENQFSDGKLMAAYALLNSGCTGKILVVTATLYLLLQQALDGMEEEAARLCPECPPLSIIDADLTTAATKLVPQIATELRRDQEISYVISGLDYVVPFIQTAIREARPDLKIISHDGVSASLQFIRSGNEPQVADIAFPPNEYMGWLALDVTARAMLDQPVTVSDVLVQLVDASNVGESDADIFPQYKGYEQEFLKVWGLN